MTQAITGIELRRLEALRAADPTSTCFAALAEALRKRGALADAATIASAGVAARPDYLPGHIVRARILSDQGDWTSAHAELESALGLDASHPVALDARDEVLRHLDGRGGAGALPTESLDDAPAADPDDMAYAEVTDDADPAEATALSEPVLTESLAMLYRGQGHLAQAVDVLDALVARTPGNPDLMAKRDALRAELVTTGPRPFDAARSGGRPVRAWLSSLATASAPPAPPASSFDAFFKAPAGATAEGDLAAFQAWLRELDR